MGVAVPVMPGGAASLPLPIVSDRVVRQLSRPRTSEPTELQRVALLVGQLALACEKHWDEIPPDHQARLKALVYAIVEPPNGLRRFVGMWMGRFLLARIILKGEHEALHAYLSACRRLTNAVLSAVEREQQRYQTDLMDAVTEANADAREIAPGDIGGWLAHLSAKAHREV